MKNVGRQKVDKSVLYAVCMGLVSAVILSTIFIGIATALVSNESLSLNPAILAMSIIQFLSAFVGCMISGLTVRDNKVVASGAVFGVYYLLLIGVSALFMNGISGKFWIGLLATVIGCVAAIFLCTRKKTTVRSL